MPLTWSGAGRSAVDDLEHPAGRQARRLRGRARARRAARRRPATTTKARASAAGRAATSASRSSACRWSMRASAGPKAPLVARDERRRRRADELLSGGAMAGGAAARVGAAASRARPASPATTSSASSRRAIRRRPSSRRRQRRRASATRRARRQARSPTSCALTTDRNGAASSRSRTCRRSTRPTRDRCRGDLHRPERRGADRRDAHRRSGRARSCSASRPARWASNRGSVKFSVARARHRGQADQGPERSRCAAASARSSRTRKRMVGGFYAYDNRTDVKDLGSLCSGTTDDARPARCARRRSTAAGQVELIAEAKDAQGRAGRGRGQRLGHEAGRALVRAGQRRPHRRAAREEALRARRDRAVPGAHAVPRGDRAGRGRARRRDRDAGRDAARRRPDGRAEDRADLGPERLRQRARAARPDPRRCRGIRSSPGAGRSRSNGGAASGTTARSTRRRRRWSTSPSRRSSSASPRSRSASPAHELQVERHGRQAAVPGARRRRSPQVQRHAGRQAAGRRRGRARRGRRRPARAARNDSWNLLDAMMQRARLGRRDQHRAERDHRPAPLRPQGGRRPAAAAAAARRASCSTRCCVWKPSVVLDANGEATVEVPLNDSLTSFRLVAVADAERAASSAPAAPASASRRTCRCSPACRRWCARATSFRAMLTLRNTTAREMKVRATPAGHGQPARRSAPRSRACRSRCRRRTSSLAAGAAKEVVWPVDVPADAFSIAWEAAADEQASAQGPRSR